MRLFDTLLAFLALLGLLALAGWSYLQFPELANTYESQLRTQVAGALETSGHDWAEFTIDGQRVYISGAAPTAEAENSAIESVLTAAGSGGPVFGGIMQVEATFDRMPAVSPFIWRATRTADGVIVLSGHVPSSDIQAGLAAQLAAIGGLTLDDRAQIAAGVPEGDWADVAGIGLASVAALDTGQARLENRTLTVSGLAMDDERRARISAQVANVPAPFVGEPNIEGPSLWSARHIDGRLVLAGQVSTQSGHDEILQIADTHFDGEIINDMAIAAHNHRGWLEGVRLGLPHFANFESGKMAFDAEGTGFTFEGEASGSTLAYLREDMAQLDGPFAVEIAGEEITIAVDEIAGIDFSADPRQACETGFAAVLDVNDVVFASGQAEITRDSGETLDKLMAVSVQCAPNLVFELGGHTDSVGDRDYNIYLSEIRAQAVADYMTASGIDASRLSVVGYGPDAPKADNATPDGRAANRRIEFKVQERREQ